MLNCGKHVLCEKPLAVTLDQTIELVNLAKEKKVFFMEAIWSRTFPIYQKLKNIINTKEIGEVRFLIASMFKLQILLMRSKWA